MTTIANAVPRPGLRGRILKAGSWIIGGQLGAQFVRLVTNVALTRMLFPDAFGLMSVVNILITALGLFSDIGIARSIVQSKRGSDPAMLNTAWTLQVVRGQLLGLGCIVAAAVFAICAHLGMSKTGTVYADARLPWIVGVFAVVPAISGFDSIRNGVARREMRLHTLTKLDLAAQIVSAIVMLVFGWATRSIWTLVVGSITAAIVRCVIGHIFLKGHKERFQIERSALNELMSHGKWIFLFSILTFMALNGDRIFLGGIVDARQFGLYVIALLIVNVPQSLASNLCNSVVYPALSEVFRERPQGLPAVIARFQWGYDGLVTFLFALLVTAAPALVDLVYDSRYREAGWMMSILAAGMIGMRYQVVEQCYQAIGKPQFMTFANLLRLIALVAGILLGQRLDGIHGILIGVALSQFAAWPLAIWFKARNALLSWRADVLCVPAVIAGLGAGLLLTMAAHAFFPWRFL
jgi:O-antigen/teichoic acid export membrane protein